MGSSRQQTQEGHKPYPLLPSTAHTRPAIIWLPSGRMVSQAVACHGEIPKRGKRVETQDAGPLHHHKRASIGKARGLTTTAAAGSEGWFCKKNKGVCSSPVPTEKFSVLCLPIRQCPWEIPDLDRATGAPVWREVGTVAHVHPVPPSWAAYRDRPEEGHPESLPGDQDQALPQGDSPR